MADEQAEAPDSTAARVALWRAMHVQVDPPPHVFEDDVDLQLAAPDDGWRSRPDLDPDGTSGFRAAIVARAFGLDTLLPLRPTTAERATIRWHRVDRPREPGFAEAGHSYGIGRSAS